MGIFGGYTGSMNISEEKREEFARQVIKILNYGGMMQFEVTSMYGHELALLKPVELNSDGEVDFHFNYFEDDVWETAGFDAGSGCFYSEKIGGQEFCDVVTAVHFLYEVWDDKPGAAEINGDIINDCWYIGWINHLLGTRFSMEKRFRLWDNVEAYALERYEDYDDPTVKDVMQFIPDGMEYGVGGVEFSDLMYITHGTGSLTNAEIMPDTYPSDVYGCKKALEIFFEKNQNNDAVNRVWELLRKDRHEREKIEDADLLDIARFSLFLPARVIAYLTAELKNESFWGYWDKIYETIYHDEIMKQYAPQQLMTERKKIAEMPIDPTRTSEFLRQDGYFIFFDTPEELKGKPNYYVSDDDRLYWWDGTEEVVLSEEMEKWLTDLAICHKELSQKLQEKMETPDGFFKKFFMLIVEIDQYYKRIYPFQCMFYEFLQNGHKTEYRAAIELLKKISDENKEEGKIIEKVKGSWDLTSRNVTHNVGRLKVKRYLSVMANRGLRERYFGF